MSSSIHLSDGLCSKFACRTAILDIIEEPKCELAFIIQEEWSPEIIVPGCTTCTLRDFLGGLRACIQGLVFMHAHHVAHLDISLRNILTDNKGRYCYIDFETTRIFPPTASQYTTAEPTRHRAQRNSRSIPTHGTYRPRVRQIRATDVPPELDRGEESDPFKVDIWQLGMLMLNASKVIHHLVDGGPVSLN